MDKYCTSSKTSFELCPRPGDEIDYYTQLPLNGIVEIPVNKPPKEQIFNTMHEIDITKFITITVKKPPGKKILTVGKFMIGIEYIAKTEDQKMHFAHFDIPFQALIKNKDGSLLPLDFDINQYIVHVCVEYEQYVQIDERTISYEIILLIWLQKNT